MALEWVSIFFDGEQHEAAELLVEIERRYGVEASAWVEEKFDLDPEFFPEELVAQAAKELPLLPPVIAAPLPSFNALVRAGAALFYAGTEQSPPADSDALSFTPGRPLRPSSLAERRQERVR